MSYFTGMKITDVTGVNVAAVKPGSTTPSIIDPYLVVGLSPNSLGPTTVAGSLSVTLASDQPAIPVSLTSPFVQINNEALNPVPVSVVAGVDANIRSVGNAPYTLGANVSANSMPVTIASDQPAINVNIAGGAGNAAAGPTGSPVPTSADYQGINIGGNLVGVTGFSLTNSKAEAVAIVDGSGNQITSFGGGTQYADNAVSGATPTGTLSMGWDSTNSVVRALKVDPNQNLSVTADGSSLLRQEIRETNAWLMKSYLLFGGDPDTIGVAQTVSTCVQLNPSSLFVAQGNSGTNLQSWWAQIGDTVNGPVAVKPAINTTTIPPTFTTAGAANANPALTTTLSPNSGIPAVVQKTSGTGIGSQTSLTTSNFANPVTAGNSIVVVAGYGGAGLGTVTDTLGHSYTQVLIRGTGTFIVGIYFITNIKGGPNAVTFTPPGSTSIDIAAYEVTGIIGVGGGGATGSQQGSVDVFTSSTGTSTVPASGSISTQFPNEIAFGGIGIGTAAQTPTAFSPWNKDFTLNTGGTPAGIFSLSTFSQPLGAPSSVSLTATIVSEPWVAAIVSFKPVLQAVSGTVTVIGTTPTGTSLVGNPVTVAGIDGSFNVQILPIGSAVTPNTTPNFGIPIISACTTTAPSLATGQSIAVQSDYQGSVFVKPYRRGQTVAKATPIASVAATTILAAQAAGIFADISTLIITAAGIATSVNTTATLSDGTNSYVFNFIPGTATAVGESPLNFTFNPPLPAATAATAWTMTMSTANAVNVLVIAVLQKTS